jgi:glycosyltransferase involved in cell wall biosynthesis
MKPIILSICIPTYNRAKSLKRCIENIIQYKSQFIEIIISSNNSVDNTDEVVKSLDDGRIRYFKNKKNLGFDENLLKTVEYANGEYVFFLSDEDFIDHNALSRLLTYLSKKNNVSQILGTVIQHDNRIYSSYGDMYLKKGSESLERILFNYTYMSGIVLKKNSLDLEKAKSYISCAYMFIVFQAQAMVKGDTLCSSRIFCAQGPVENESFNRKEILKSSDKGKPIANPYHYSSRIYQLKEKIRLVYEISEDDRTKNILLNKLTIQAADSLVSAPAYHLKPFFSNLWSIKEIRHSKMFVPYLFKCAIIHILFKVRNRFTVSSCRRARLLC